MRIFKDTPFEFGFLSWRIDPPEISALIVVKATFDLVPRGPCPIAEVQAPTSGEVLHDDVDAPSAREGSDFAIVKPKAEWWLSGLAYAPKGEPTRLLRVSVKVGEQEEKTLAVHGDRRWERHLLRTRPSEAAPFTTMPLRWERAFGGHSVPANPVGAGVDPVTHEGATFVPLPNIEAPERPIASLEDRPRPAGLFPIAESWPARMKVTGTYDERWQKERWPWYPEDFDYAFFNAAPEDQRQSEPFRGDEALVLKGLHPDHPSLECRLPGLIARCFVEWEVEEAAAEPGSADVEGGLEREFDEDAFTLIRGGAGGGGGGRRESEGDEAEERPGPTLRIVRSTPAEEPGEEGEFAGEFADEFDGEFDEEEETSRYLDGNAAEILVHEFDEEFVEDEETRAIRSGVFRTDIEEEEEIDEEGSTAFFGASTSAALRPSAGAREALAGGEGEPHDADRARLEAQIPRPRLEEVLLRLDTLAIDTEAKQVRCVFRGLIRGLRDDSLGGVARLFFSHDSLEDPDLEGEDDEARRLRHEARLHELLVDEALEEQLYEGDEPPEPEPADGPDPLALHPNVERAQLAVAQLYETMGEILGEGPITASAAELKAGLKEGQGEGEPLPEEIEALEDPVSPPEEDETSDSLRRLAILVLYMRGRSARGRDLSGAPFRGLALKEMDLSGSILAGADLSGADLSGATLDGCALAEASLARANLEGASLTEADLRGADLSGARLKGAKLDGADLDGAILTEAKLTRASLRGASLEGASLARARLNGALLDEAELPRADLEGADLREASLVEASLEGAAARGALFDGAILTGLRAGEGADFGEASFLGVRAEGSQWQTSSLAAARLIGAELKEADLSEASLSGASLEHANLRGARLDRADLRAARLLRSDLFEASLEGADLRGVDARGASFFGAGLWRARVEEADFEGADLGRTLLAEGQGGTRAEDEPEGGA